MPVTRSGTVRPGRDGVTSWPRARTVRARAGFTLIEVSLALAIAVVVAAAIVPLSLSLIERTDARAVTDRLSAGVRLATAEAARRGAVVTLCARERRGLDVDLVLQVGPGGGGGGGGGVEQVVDPGVELPRGWRIEGVEEGGARSGGAGMPGGESVSVNDRSAPAGESAASETLTPIGSALPDGRFVGLVVAATTAERGATVKPANAAAKAPGDEASPEAPARLTVRVDALSGRVSLSAPDADKARANEPGEAPSMPDGARGPASSRQPAPPPSLASTTASTPPARPGVPSSGASGASLGDKK